MSWANRKPGAVMDDYNALMAMPPLPVGNTPHTGSIGRPRR
ncbi:MAG: hypothetical protein ACLP9Y_21800 [Mycobacterium sp.]